MKILGNQGLEFPDGSIQSNAAYAAWRNLILNGDMRIDQRNNGAAVTPIAGTTYITDRWGFQSSIASKLTLQQVAGRKVGQAKAVKITVASSYTPTTTERAYFRQGIEGINVANLAWGGAGAQPITVSFDFECTVSGDFSVALRNADATRTYVTTFSYPTPNIQQPVSFNVVGCTDGAWDTGTGAGITLSFDLGAGPDATVKTATKNAWVNGGQTAATGATTFVSTATGSAMYVSNVQLEAGTKATPFERRFLADEEMRCRRYLPRLAGGAGMAYGLNAAQVTFPLIGSPRVAPTGLLVVSYPTISGSGSVQTANGMTYAGGATNSVLVNIGSATNFSTAVGHGCSVFDGTVYGTGCEL